MSKKNRAGSLTEIQDAVIPIRVSMVLDGGTGEETGGNGRSVDPEYSMEMKSIRKR